MSYILQSPIITIHSLKLLTFSLLLLSTSQSAASIKIALASTKTILHTRLAFDSRRTTQSSRNILSGEFFEYLDRYCRRPRYWWSLLTRIYDAAWPGARLMRQSYVVLCRRSWISDGMYSRGTRVVRSRRKRSVLKNARFIDRSFLSVSGSWVSRSRRGIYFGDSCPT